MAAELVGTAYVRIRAITAGLAKEISDGVDKGVKGADVDKAGEVLGTDLSEGAGRSFGKEFGDDAAKGVAKGLDAPDVHKAGEDGGKGISRDVSKGFDDETKRRNPFGRLVDAFGRMRGRLRSEVGDGIGDSLDNPDLLRRAEDSGAKLTRSFGRGVDRESKKDVTFAGLTKSFSNFAARLRGIPIGGPKFWLTVFSPNIIRAIAPVVASAIAGLTSAVGLLATAAVGAGAALGGMFGLAVPGIGALVAAFKVATPELEDFKETAQELLKPWQQVGIATQKSLLPGVTNLLRQIRHLVPLFVRFGEDIGEVFGAMATMAGAIVTNERNMTALADVLEMSVEFWESMRTAALNVLDAVLPFFRVAAPLGLRLADSIERMAIKLHDFIILGAESGTLEATLTKWYDRAEQVARILGNVFDALWDVLNIGADAGAPLLARIEEVTQGWSDFTSSVEGKNAIAEWYERAKPLLSELWGLFQDIAEIVLAPLVIGGDTTPAIEFIRFIREDVLPWMQRLSDAFRGHNLADSLGRLAESFVLVIEAVTGAGGGTLTTIIESLAGMLELLAVALENPYVQTAATTLIQIFLALKVFGYLISPLTMVANAITGLSGALSTISAALASPIAAPLIAIAAAVGLLILVWRNWDTIEDALRSAWDWFSKLARPLQILIGVFAAFLLIMNPVAWAVAIVGVIKHWDAVREKLIEVWEAVRDFVLGLPDLLRRLPGMFLEFVGRLPEILGDVVDSLQEQFGRLPEILGGLADRALDALSGLGDMLLDFFRDLGPNIAAALSEFGGMVREGIITAVRNLPDLILDTLGALGELGGMILRLIADGLQAALPRIGQLLIELPTIILDALGTVASKLLPIGGRILQFIVEGLVKALPKIGAFILRLPFEILTLLRKGLEKALPAIFRFAVDLIGALLEGLIDQAPRVFKWFQDLPGNILGFLADAAEWLLETGFLIIQGMINGVINNIGRLWDWLRALPSTLLSFVTGAATWLWDVGVQLLQGLLDGMGSVFGSFSEFFYNLPQKAVDFITSAVGVLFDIGKNLPVQILNGVIAGAQDLFDWFIGLPGAIWDLLVEGTSALMDLGADLIGWIVDGIVEGAQVLWDWVTDLPGLIWDTLNTVVSEIWNIGINLITQILVGIGQIEQDIWDWFLDLPGNAWDALVGIKDTVVGIGRGLIRWIKEGLVAIGSQLWDWFKDLPTRIWNALVAAKDSVVGIGRGIVRWVIEGLSGLARLILDKLQAALDWAVKNLNPVNIGSKIVGAATFGLFGGEMGGIFDRPTPLVIGEAGREALIPVTKPARAMALMQASGLDTMVLNAYAGSGTTAAGKPVLGNTTLLHIENATITAPVDADMIVQKVTAAYNRLAS